MGDGADFSDIERFLRSAEGKEHVAGIAARLEGRSITGVSFTNQGWAVGISIELDGGESLGFTLSELDVSVLRDDFDTVLEREYQADFPERSI